MENNTVLLSLNDYNNLRDFRNKMELGYTYRYSFESKSGQYTVSETYITTEEAIEYIVKNNELQEERYKNEIESLKENLELLLDQINTTKKMNWFQFIKYLCRRS